MSASSLQVQALPISLPIPVPACVVSRLKSDVMLKGTRVDGVYTADPEKDPTATKFDAITYKDVLARGLKVMDLTAICMCQDNNLPIYVFNMDIVGNLKRVMDGEEIGTLVYNG